MINYSKPTIEQIPSLHLEGIYLASGGAVCGSQLMNGKYHTPNYNTGNNADRGCEGCPANWSNGRCNRDQYDTGYFKPWWE